MGNVADYCEFEATNFIKELMNWLGVDKIWNNLHAICM